MSFLFWFCKITFLTYAFFQSIAINIWNILPTSINIADNNWQFKNLLVLSRLPLILVVLSMFLQKEYICYLSMTSVNRIWNFITILIRRNWAWMVVASNFSAMKICSMEAILQLRYQLTFDLHCWCCQLIHWNWLFNMFRSNSNLYASWNSMRHYTS